MTTLTDSEASISTVVMHTPCNESGHDNTDGFRGVYIDGGYAYTVQRVWP